jgi:hypothetical protein
VEIVDYNYEYITSVKNIGYIKKTAFRRLQVRTRIIIFFGNYVLDDFRTHLPAPNELENTESNLLIINEKAHQ